MLGRLTAAVGERLACPKLPRYDAGARSVSPAGCLIPIRVLSGEDYCITFILILTHCSSVISVKSKVYSMSLLGTHGNVEYGQGSRIRPPL